MRIFLSLAVIGLTLLGNPLSPLAETLRFAPLPMEKRETVLSRFRPLTEYLSHKLQVKIDYVYAPDYAKLLAKFRRSEIDIAYLGPLPYVELRDSYPEAKPLLFFKESPSTVTYTCALVTFPDNNFDAWHGKAQKIALTQPLSTCGYLSTNGLMRNYGNSLAANNYRYIGTHDEVALAVIRGDYAAGGLKTTVARKYSHMGLFILSETPPLPAFALVVNTRTLTAERIAGIKNAMMQLESSLSDQQSPKNWNDAIGNGVAEAHDSDYKVIRDLLGSAHIPAEGNF